MIAIWMIYAIGMAAALFIAAWVAEHAFRALNRPCRGVWMAAIALSFAWPAAAFWHQATRPPMVYLESFQIVNAMSTAQPNPPLAEPAWYHQVIPTGLGASTAFLDRPLLLAWGLASIILLGQLARAFRVVRRGPAEWRPRRVDGTPVLVSRSFGPAVIGLRDFRIVIPEWVLEMNANERAFVLHHEEEHRSAGDPYALILAAVAAVLLPWNPFVWLQARRLRLAIELDCDARVLARGIDLEQYGTLLLSIAERRLQSIIPPERLGATAAIIVAALTEAPSNLERRITAMTAPRPRHPLALATTLGVVVAATLVIAARSPMPAVARTTPIALGQTVPQQGPVYGESGVDTQALLLPSSGSPAYPSDLSNSGIEGRASVQFIVSATGRVEQASVKISEATHGYLAGSLARFLDTARFSPAIKSGRAVRESVTRTFSFTLPQGSATVSMSTTPSSPAMHFWVSGRGKVTSPTTPPPSTSVATGTRVGTNSSGGRGKVASVTLAPPGADSTLRTGAIRSPFANSDTLPPLYVVDGVPLINTTNTASDFAGLDIRSVEILRGEAATKLYGSRAKGGVIAITTWSKAARDSARAGTDTATVGGKRIEFDKRTEAPKDTDSFKFTLNRAVRNTSSWVFGRDTLSAHLHR